MGRFMIKDKLGHGNFGEVYEAREPLPRGEKPKRVAIKIVKFDDEEEGEDIENTIFKTLMLN